MSQRPLDRSKADAPETADQAASSNGRAESTTKPKTFGQRVASSASGLARDAFAADRAGAAPTLSASLQAGGKASGSAQSSSSAAAAGSADLTAHERAAKSASSGSEARTALSAVGESFRSGPAPDAGPMYGDSAAAVLTETLDRQWQASDKGKGRAAAANDGNAWSHEFSSPRWQQQQPEHITAEQIYARPGDGIGVVNMLSDPGFNPEAVEMGDEYEATETSAEGLFSATAESGLQQQESSRLIPENADVLTNMTGIKAGEDGSTRAATEGWLSAWSDVLDNYTNYVWSPDDEERVQAARVELEKLKSGRQEQSQGEQSQTVQRLRQILGHLDPNAVPRSRPGTGTTQMERAQEVEVVSRSPSPESWD